MAKKKIDKPARAAGFKEKGEAILADKNPAEVEPKQKRHRRTQAEISAERNSLNDNGYELIADLIKTISDNDHTKYGLDKEPRVFFEPLARQYASIMNYFMPAAKPIYFACGTALLGTFMMLKSRAEKIAKILPTKEIKPNGDNPTGKKSNLGTGEARPGQVFPGEEQPVKV